MGPFRVLARGAPNTYSLDTRYPSQVAHAQGRASASPRRDVIPERLRRRPDRRGGGRRHDHLPPAGVLHPLPPRAPRVVHQPAAPACPSTAPATTFFAGRVAGLQDRHRRDGGTRLGRVSLPLRGPAPTRSSDRDMRFTGAFPTGLQAALGASPVLGSPHPHKSPQQGRARQWRHRRCPPLRRWRARRRLAGPRAAGRVRATTRPRTSGPAVGADSAVGYDALLDEHAGLPYPLAA